MEKIGFLLITDSVSGMTRDNVNLEDRVICKLEDAMQDITVFGRTVEAKNSQHAARLFRRKSSNYSFFSSKLDKSFCYIMLGNTEKNYGIKNNFWFKHSILNIVNEALFLGYDPVLVFSSPQHEPVRRRSYSSQGSKKIIRIPKGDDWAAKCRAALEEVCQKTNSRFIESALNCPRQWDTPDIQSIKAMRDVISTDISQNIDTRLKNKPNNIKSKPKSILVFSSSSS